MRDNPELAAELGVYKALPEPEPAPEPKALPEPDDRPRIRGRVSPEDGDKPG